MAKEDIVKKDLVTDLKDMQDENNQAHLKPVNVIVGRYQPFTIGHLGMAKELEKINDLPSVYIYIRSKSGKNSKFSTTLTTNYMEDLVQGQKIMVDAWSMESVFIPVIILESQRRGYNPVLIGAGEDRAKVYTAMAKKMMKVGKPIPHPDFKIQELKGRLTSGTEVRQAITDGDEKKFKKYTPKEIHQYYPQLKAELENSSVLTESLSIEDVVDSYDIDIEVIENILESHGFDLFSDAIIIESILDYEFSKENKKEIMNEGKMSDIDLIAKESKDLNSFKKTINKEYPDLKDDEIEQLYSDMSESVNEDYSMKIGKRVEVKQYDQFKNQKVVVDAEIVDANKDKVTFEIKQGSNKGKTKTVSNKVFKGILQESVNEGELSIGSIVYFETPDTDGLVEGEIIKINGDVYTMNSRDGKFRVKRSEILDESKIDEANKLKFKEDYPIYHDSFGSALDGITNYVESAGYKIDDDEFYSAFGDAFFKPKKGKTLRKSVELQDGNGNVIGNLHAQIYNRGTDGNPYELNVYTDQIKRGLRESINEGDIGMSNRVFLREVHPVLKNFKHNNKAKNELLSLIKEFYGDHGITIFEHMLSINDNAIARAHTRVFERVIMFRKGELTLECLDNQREQEIVTFLSKLDESKLEHFKNYINEAIVSPDYEAKIDAAVCGLIKSNRPVVWEDFKSSMIRSDFFKRDFKPFLMLQGLTDYQIDRFVENILRVKYQHYSNYFTGSVGLQYTFDA